MTPSGRQLTLSAGAYTAVVTEVGASLREFLHDGAPVTRGYAEDRRMHLHRGGLLAPWPNRIRDGKYSFGGIDYQLAVNEVTRNTAIHGLVNWHAWSVESATETSAVLTTTVWPQPGYDFTLAMRVEYVLGAGGLDITLTATNAGAAAAPYGASIHPYLVGGEGLVNDWTLTVPATTSVDVDPERLLPTGGSREVAGTELDFQQPRLVGTTELDHPLTGITPGDDGQAVARVVGPDGHGAEIRWDPTACPWVQVHTADRPDPEDNRVGMAIEPMTCPPDAFRSGDGLLVLQPGESSTVSWTIRAV